MNLLQTTCPKLAKELIAKYQKRKDLPNEEGKNKDGVRLCCGKNQLLETQRQFGIPASLLGRCPTCLENFQDTFCNLGCSPGNDEYCVLCLMMFLHYVSIATILYN